MSLGKSLDSYGSKLFSGPLGVVQIGFKGYDLGLTTDQTSLKPDLDMKDIMYQQKGTKAYDHVVTGADWVLSATFGEINTELLVLIAPYLIESQGAVDNDSGVIKAKLYESLLDSIAGGLRVSAVVDMAPSEDLENIMDFYLAIPIINSDLIQWGADQQRNIPVEFRLKPKVMSSTESTTHSIAHGYWGDPTDNDLPAIDWPDLTAPYPTAQVVNSATEVEITLSEAATEVSGVTSTERFILKVNSAFVAPTAVAYSSTTITLTLPASSIASGDTVYLSISAGTFEDSESNENEAQDSLVVTNSL